MLCVLRTTVFLSMMYIRLRLLVTNTIIMVATLRLSAILVIMFSRRRLGGITSASMLVKSLIVRHIMRMCSLSRVVFPRAFVVSFVFVCPCLW